MRVLECGICGTDRDIASGKYGTPPDGRATLVLGHENLGQVESIGEGVVGWTPGDLVVATVRRGCDRCRFCRSGRSDFCSTGLFTERGIKGQDGYIAESYVDRPDYLVHVPAELRAVAVLLEPLSVVEKAIDEGLTVLSRREPTREPPVGKPRALVAGTGAIGMLGAFRLRADGWEVVAVDRHGEDTPAAGLLKAIGARHLNVGGGLDEKALGRFDVVLEASGSAVLDLGLLPMLGPNGVLVLTGIPAADAPSFPIEGGRLLRDLVLLNQAIVGSVNANRSYFEAGVRDMVRFRAAFGGALDRVIGERIPLEGFARPLADRGAGAIKSVLTIAP